MVKEGYRFGGEWTQEKLRMVEDYLSAYTTALKNTPFKLGYIDAFAGTGHITDAEAVEPSLFPNFNDPERAFLEGSARMALEVEPPFDTYLFIERNPEAYEELVELEKEYEDKDVRTYNADANSWLREICLERGWAKNRAVVFLDPYGMQVEWETVEAIAETESIDMWTLFPLGVATNRVLKRNGEIPEGWRRRLNAVFGTDEWEKHFYKTNPNLFGEESKQKVVDLHGIGEYYNARLGDIFAGVADNPRYLYNSMNNPLYLLCFAVGNPNAKEVGLRIAQHILSP